MVVISRKKHASIVYHPYIMTKRVDALWVIRGNCTIRLQLTSAMHTLLRASRAVWNAHARVCVVENFVVAYLELRRTLRYVQRPRDESDIYIYI